MEGVSLLLPLTVFPSMFSLNQTFLLGPFFAARRNDTKIVMSDVEEANIF